MGKAGGKKRSLRDQVLKDQMKLVKRWVVLRPITPKVLFPCLGGVCWAEDRLRVNIEVILREEPRARGQGLAVRKNGKSGVGSRT